MKKRFLALAALACCCTFSVGAFVKASAGVVATTVVEDSFNDVSDNGSYNDDYWTAFTADNAKTIAQPETLVTSLRIPANKINGEEILLATTDRLSGITAIQFDILVPSSTNAWCGFNIIQNSGEYFTQSNWHLYSCPFTITKSGMNGLGGTWSDGAKTKWEDLLGENGADKWLTIKVVPKSATVATVSAGLQGGELKTAGDVTLKAANTSRTSFTEGYFAFSSADGGGDQLLDNFRITTQNGEIVEDFNNGIPTEGMEVVKKTGTAYQFNLYSNNTVTFTQAKANDRLIAVEEIKEDESVLTSLECLDVSFTAKLPAGTTDEIAFVFGLEEQDGDPTKNAVAYIVGATGGRLVQFDENGENVLDATAANVNVLNGVTSAEGATVRISVNKNGNVKISENGLPVKTADGAEAEFSPVGYAGYFGFVSYADMTGSISLDDAKAVNVNYKVPVTKSVTHNFSSDYFGNEAAPDFIAVGDPKTSMYVQDGKLVWDGTSDESVFGSAHEYDSFIMDYKVCNVYVGTEDMADGAKTAAGKWIGLDIGRSKATLKGWAEYAMFFFQITPTGETSGVSFYTNSNSKVDKDSVVTTQVKPIPASLWKAIQYDGVLTEKHHIDEGDAVCVRWVMENDVLSLYLKKASETAFTKYFEAKNLQATGYVALRSTGYTYLELDDFSMANTSSVYICAENHVPETVIKTEEVIIYDRGNVDVNWDEEIKANENSGCGSAVSPVGITLSAFAIVGVVLTKKRRK